MKIKEIEIVYNRVYSDLQSVLRSSGWLVLLSASHDPVALEITLGNALFHSSELKLKVNQIVEQRKL